MAPYTRSEAATFPLGPLVMKRTSYLANGNFLGLPSRELTYPPDKACLKMIFLFARWDMLIMWRVIIYIFSRENTVQTVLFQGPMAK